MKHVWRVRAALVLLIVVFGIILAVNFRSPESPVQDSESPVSTPAGALEHAETSPSAGAMTRIISGTHLLRDENGQLMGKLLFGEAVQTETGTRMQNIHVVLNDGTAFRTNIALVEDDGLRFPDALRFTRTDGVRLLVPPGSVLRGAELTGLGLLAMETTDLRIHGETYRLKLRDSRLMFGKNVHVSAVQNGLVGHAVRAEINLSNGRIVLVEGVRLVLPFAGKEMQFHCDAAVIQQESGEVRLAGSVTGWLGNRQIQTTDIRMSVTGKKDDETSIYIHAPAYVASGQSWFAIPSGQMKPDGVISTSWLAGETDGVWISTGPATLAQNGSVLAISPWVRTADDMKIRGSKLRQVPGQPVEMTHVMGWSDTSRFRAERARFKAGAYELEGWVRVRDEDHFMVAETARRTKGGWLLTDAVVFRETGATWLSANQLAVISGDRLRGQGDVTLISQMLDGERVVLTANEAGWQDGQLFGKGSVRIAGSHETILGRLCLLTSRFGVVTQALIKGNQSSILAGAGLLVLMPANQPSRLLYNAWAQDAGGNVLRADQLTWQRATGRISAYGASNNVQFKLEL